mgnify:CR=1 FL=1
MTAPSSGPVRVRPVAASAMAEDEPVTIDPGTSTEPGDPATIVVGTVSRTAAGVAIVEVVAGGWRFELEVESEARARLRERATRVAAVAGSGAAMEVHAMIPGRVVSVSVATGDPVRSGQQLLVVEAMKMQNELRTPRDGTVERVAVGVGETIDLGDLLMVIG